MSSGLFYEMLTGHELRQQRDPRQIIAILRDQTMTADEKNIAINGDPNDPSKPGLPWMSNPIELHNRDPFFVLAVTLTVAFTTALAVLLMVSQSWWWWILEWVLLFATWTSTYYGIKMFVPVPTTYLFQRKLFGWTQYFNEGAFVLIWPGQTITMLIPGGVDIQQGDLEKLVIKTPMLIKVGEPGFNNVEIEVIWTMRLRREFLQSVILNFENELLTCELERGQGQTWTRRLEDAAEKGLIQVREKIRSQLQAAADAFFLQYSVMDLIYHRKLLNEYLTNILDVELFVFAVEVSDARISDAKDDGTGWISNNLKLTEQVLKSQTDVGTLQARMLADVAEQTTRGQTQVATLEADRAIAVKQSETAAAQTEAELAKANIALQPVLAKLEMLKGRGNEVLLSQLQQLSPEQWNGFIKTLTDPLKSELQTFLNLGGDLKGTVGQIHPIVALLPQLLDAYLKAKNP